FSADGSVGFPHVRVGHRQAFNYKPLHIPCWGFFISLSLITINHLKYKTLTIDLEVKDKT
ncbi:hypothetical protein, partial [Pleionea sediminis]|uniref:hypothetical protein n=1 Tax=Pleionea sediminis TaxID=2569479 RepID=UPI00197B4434